MDLNNTCGTCDMSAINDPSVSSPAVAGAGPDAQGPSQTTPAVDETHLAVDDETSDEATSEVGGSVASSKTSLADSIYNYRLENGRTYHRYKDGKYFYPNDDRESDRLDLQHYQFLLSLDGKLGLSPPNENDSQVKRVLDVGTGTGIWAVEFGDLHPQAEVVGVDLSPPQTEVPPNVTFEVDDVEEPWLFGRPFDYIHSRMMTSSLSNWRQFIQTSFDNLNPGGYLELQEMDLMPQSDDGTLRPDTAIVKCFELLGQAAGALNHPFQDIPALVKILQEVGFEDVYIRKVKWPTNTWPKEEHHKTLGTWAHENCMAGIEGWTIAPLTRGLGWRREEVQVLLIKVREEFRDRSIHAYWPCYAIYGRKPKAD
ncbi:Secondary metabolism regulator LAE1 [Colletotrichum orbiculare MAFF 240422]|uniref:Secondary metabolism regulator LAE1 n=1 Tax=Colletotrichum orbiculare (strain 104-T / ATCC 96160 / CBS 514.97 / LARS 414 / MAFF 240422) TaxID=1213857 RepID=A0A484F7F6_COLOR|nr:Secondary metabolism regulator LAE1 [Colletotrichum orbiculare MAFF 240422]